VQVGVKLTTERRACGSYNASHHAAQSLRKHIRHIVPALPDLLRWFDVIYASSARGRIDRGSGRKRTECSRWHSVRDTANSGGNIECVARKRRGSDVHCSWFGS
jgi:hypothetical protein